MSVSPTLDVVVIGGGPAGVTGALRAAELGARTALVEADRLGGTCVNHGCVPTRVLARAARLARDAAHASDYGIDVAVAGVDWPRLVARVRRGIEDVRATKDSATRLADAGVEVVHGHARFVAPDRIAVTRDGRPERELVTGATLLCVGGRAARPPLPGADLAILADEVVDLPALPRRVVVVGSGNTGVQLATIFSSFGSEVTVVELAERLLPPADHDVGTLLAEAFRDQGMRIVLGHGVARIDRTDDGLAVTLDDDEVLAADTVVLATGWPANTAGLGLDAAGVAVERGRIPVDAFFRTNVPGILVPGDANGRDMLVQSAEVEARAAATNAVLGPTAQAPHALLPWGGFTDPDIAGVGLTEDAARERGARVRVARVDYAEMERPVIDGRTRGMCKLVVDAEARTILGAHAIGEKAVEVIQAVTTAMAANTDVATLARVEYAYPSYTAILGRAAQRLLDGSPSS